MARSLRKIGVVAMALVMVFAMAVGAFATTDSVDTTTTYNVEFFKADGSSSMANNALNGGTAVYDPDARTLTIPVKKTFMMYPVNGILTMCYGCLTGVDVTGTSASGTAEYEATEIVINNFDLNDANSYDVAFTVTVKKATTGAELDIPEMSNAAGTMVLS